MNAKYGKNDLRTAKALKNRGGIENFKGDTKAAVKTFEETISIYKKLKDLTEPDLKGFADVLEALGTIRAEQNLVSSEGLFKEALELRERTSGPESPEAATALSFLASINFFRRNFDKASELYARTLASVAKSVETSKQDVSLIYYRTECSYRKADIAERFEEIKSKYGPEGTIRPVGASNVLPRSRKVVQEGVVNGKASRLEKPKYPGDARAAGARGTVTVNILIDEKGNVISACSVDKSIHPSLVVVSEVAAYASKFEPTTLDGKPVKVAGKLTYTFSR
jgi:TonB family protein